MPLTIPPASTLSIEPFLQAAASRLEDYYSLTNRLSSEPRSHRQEVKGIVDAVRAGSLDMKTLLAELRKEPLLSDPVVVRYRAEIADGLVTYLNQNYIEARDGWSSSNYRTAPGILNHETILMTQAKFQPEEMRPVIAAMSELNSDQITAILTRSYNSGSYCKNPGYNLLMYVARFFPDTVTPLLATMNEGLTPQQKAEILTKTSLPFRSRNGKEGYNVLMLALLFHPELHRQKMLKGKSDAEKARLLQAKPDGSDVLDSRDGLLSAFMLAVREQRDAVGPILEAMNDALSQEQKTAILTQADNDDGMNALMLAAVYHPDSVKLILAAMNNWLSTRQNQDILRATNKEGKNVLDLVSKKHPAYGLLIDAIDTMRSPAASSTQQTIILIDDDYDSDSDVNKSEDIPDVDLPADSPAFRPYHPGIPSIQMAQENYNLFLSDHVPVMVNVPYLESTLRVISWNVMEGDSFNGVAPLGHSSYGEYENPKLREDRYNRIADAILLMLNEQKPDFFTLQEIRAYLPGNDGSLEILPDGLWTAIAARLEGTNYEPATYNESIIDTAGNITLYNREEFTPIITPPQGNQQVASLPQQHVLGAHALTFVPIFASQPAPRIRLCNVHADYNDVPMVHESNVRQYLNAGDSVGTSIVVGDFNCMIAPLDNEHQIIATSAVPNVFRNNTMQGACAIDGAFYKSDTDPVTQAESIHINVTNGRPYSPDQLALSPLQFLPASQRRELTRFRMVMSADNPFAELQTRLNDLIGENRVTSIGRAVNLQNTRAMTIEFSNANAEYFNRVGLTSTQVMNQVSGSTSRVAFLPMATAELTLNKDIIPAILKDHFLTAHQERFQQDSSRFYGFFSAMRNSRINKYMSLEKIIEHAQRHNNRSREVCVQLGWLDRNGTVINPAINEILEHSQQADNRPGNSR